MTKDRAESPRAYPKKRKTEDRKLTTLESLLNETFGTSEPRRVFAPYRVCPIGAHVDHQYGKITGFAIDRGIEIFFTPTDDGEVRMRSANLDGAVEFTTVEPPEVKTGDWGDYLRGATLALKRTHKVRRGMIGVIHGMLPIGGLSSSAALTLAFLSALCSANEIVLSHEEMILNALWAENEYVGVHCGKLDQSCIVYCKRDSLLYLDTRDDSYELIPRNPATKPFDIMIFFSGVERKLVGSPFNMRVDEMKSAAYALKAFSGMEYREYKDTRLRDVPREVYEAHKHQLPEPWRLRAEHFYGEVDRVERGAEAWRRGDIEEYGRLSFESCTSSIENYQTGSDELRTLCDIMRHTEGIYGGRFSGAGFKGCCMALVDPAYEQSIMARVEREYLAAFPELSGKYSACVCHPSDAISQ